MASSPALPFYPSVEVVRYMTREGAPPESSTRALEFLQEADEEFAGMLASDLYFRRVYEKYQGKHFWVNLSAEQTTDDSRKRTTLRLIVCSLKLRSAFAILQHEHLCCNIHYIQGGESEEFSVKSLVRAQLYLSMQLLRDFKDHPDMAEAITEMEELYEDARAYSKVTRVPEDANTKDPSMMDVES